MTVRGRVPNRAVLGLAVTVTLVGCGRSEPVKPGQPLMDVFSRETQEKGLTRAQTDGKRLFAQYCVTCHGEAGGGDGQNAYNLDPKPPEFQASLSTHPRTYWKQIVEGGTASVGRSPLCPPWGRSLTPSQVDALLAYLDELAKPAAAAPGAPPPKP